MKTTQKKGFTLISRSEGTFAHRNRGTIKALPSGFTLIEIMIVISIIAILTTVGFSSFTQAQMRGRDARRKADLRNISVALELYKQRNGRYPCNEHTFSNATAPWITDYIAAPNTICDNSKPALDSNYISSLPKDPLNTGGAPWTTDGFLYDYRAFDCVATNGQHYFLLAHLENPNDPDRLGAKNVKFCEGAGIIDMYPGMGAAAYDFAITNP